MLTKITLISQTAFQFSQEDPNIQYMNVFIGFYTTTFIRNQILLPKSNNKVRIIEKQITLSNLQLLSIRNYNIVAVHIFFLLQNQKTKA